MVIEVTRSHIRKGKPRSPTKCPIALAINARFASADIGVNSSYAHMSFPGEYNQRLFKLPLRARWFVWLFDNHGIGFPFKFDLVEEKRRM